MAEDIQYETEIESRMPLGSNAYRGSPQMRQQQAPRANGISGMLIRMHIAKSEKQARAIMLGIVIVSIIASIALLLFGGKSGGSGAKYNLSPELISKLPLTTQLQIQKAKH